VLADKAEKKPAHRTRRLVATGRIAATLGVLLAVYSVTFAMMRLAPGGPFEQIEGLPAEVRSNLEARFGLDRSLPEQYLTTLWGYVQGDLGPSLSYAPGRPVSDVLSETLPVSLELGLYALLLALALGVTSGALAGFRPGSRLDRTSAWVSLGVISASVIVIGALVRAFLIFRGGPFDLGGFDSWRSKVLPAVTLGLSYAAIFQRLVRSNVAAQTEGGSFEAVTARGVPARTARWRHLLPQALIPMLDYLGPAVTGILTGSFVVETIFEVPGVSSCFVLGAQARDYTLVSGAILVYTALLLLLTFVFELLHDILDPRLSGRAS